MESLLKDIQYGFRNLVKRPSYTAIALITLRAGNRREHGDLQFD